MRRMAAKKSTPETGGRGEDRKKTPEEIAEERQVNLRLCTNTDPQRDSVHTKDPADVLDHATDEMAIGSRLGDAATKRLRVEGLKRPWLPLIKLDAAVNVNVEELCSPKQPT